jgi:hypothetical protein
MAEGDYAKRGDDGDIYVLLSARLKQAISRHVNVEPFRAADADNTLKLSDGEAVLVLDAIDQSPSDVRTPDDERAINQLQGLIRLGDPGYGLY